jgi:glycosyltransferase involved in cell wall biosynthesis
VLRPSGDGSEEVIKKFSSQLPIRLILQKEGNCAYAYQLAIDNASGDLILFIDDDVVAEKQWVEKYVQLFDTLPKAGGGNGPHVQGISKRRGCRQDAGGILRGSRHAADLLPETSSGILGLHRLGF